VSEHSSIGASSAERWFNCPGSVALIPKAPEEEPSKYAEQGTAAHWVLEECLGTDEDPQDYVGEEAPNGVTLKQEDIDAIIETIELLEEFRKEKKYILLKEIRVDLRIIYEDLFGTADVIFVSPDLSDLAIFDYKHGAGKLVQVYENKQGMYYGLGGIKHASDKYAEGMLEMLGWGHVFGKVTIGIIQPRATHRDGPFRTWVVPPARLDEFAEELKLKAKATRQKDAPLVAGPWCSGTWCPARFICPQPIKMAQEVAKVEFSVVEDPKLPKPETLSNEEIIKVLEIEDLMKSWFNSAKAHVQSIIENGGEFPGFKIVKTKPNRKWIDENETIETIGMAVSEEDMYSKKLKSPAQMEKQLGKKHKTMVADLCFIPEGTNVLAPEHDKRPAVECGPQVDFERIEQ